MTLVGFELAIPASEQPQTHALHHAATGIGSSYHLLQLNMVQMIPVRNFTCYFFTIHFHFILLSFTGLPSGLFSMHNSPHGNDNKMMLI